MLKCLCSVQKRRKELQDAWIRLEEVRIFLDEDLHNVGVQEDATKLDMVVHKGEEYIAKGLRYAPGCGG